MPSEPRRQHVSDGDDTPDDTPVAAAPDPTPDVPQSVTARVERMKAELDDELATLDAQIGVEVAKRDHHAAEVRRLRAEREEVAGARARLNKRTYNRKPKESTS